MTGTSHARSSDPDPLDLAIQLEPGEIGTNLVNAKWSRANQPSTRPTPPPDVLEGSLDPEFSGPSSFAPPGPMTPTLLDPDPLDLAIQLEPGLPSDARGSGS